MLGRGLAMDEGFDFGEKTRLGARISGKNFDTLIEDMGVNALGIPREEIGAPRIAGVIKEFQNVSVVLNVVEGAILAIHRPGVLR